MKTIRHHKTTHGLAGFGGFFSFCLEKVFINVCWPHICTLNRKWILSKNTPMTPTLRPSQRLTPPPLRDDLGARLPDVPGGSDQEKLKESRTPRCCCNLRPLQENTMICLEMMFFCECASDLSFPRFLCSGSMATSSWGLKEETLAHEQALAHPTSSNRYGGMVRQQTDPYSPYMSNAKNAGDQMVLFIRTFWDDRATLKKLSLLITIHWFYFYCFW